MADGFEAIVEALDMPEVGEAVGRCSAGNQAHRRMIQPDLFSRVPPGIPPDVWQLFCIEADKIRAYRKHYSARTIAEYIRHHRAIDAGGREFVLNNNWVPIMAREYMAAHNCAGFFETRERQAA